MQGLFSKRFRQALDDHVIPYPSFPRTLRKRLAMACVAHDDIYDSSGFAPPTYREALDALKRAYGVESLRIQDRDTGGQRDTDDFSEFLVYSYPHCVLDALEAQYRLLPNRDAPQFQSEINAILLEENSAWRMSEGQMYMVDSAFLDAHKDTVARELKSRCFLGAHEELSDARNHLMAGDHDDAIQKANRAFESTLKSVLNQREGTADQLLKKLSHETDLLASLPDDAQKALISKVLPALPVLRHKVGGHGQGNEPIDLPRAYGYLAINLAATYMKFVLDLQSELRPPDPEPDPTDDIDDDIPF